MVVSLAEAGLRNETSLLPRRQLRGVTDKSSNPKDARSNPHKEIDGM
jgi:hypothetical protein